MKGFTAASILLLVSVTFGAEISSKTEAVDQARSKRNPPFIAEPILGLGLGYASSFAHSPVAISTPLVAPYASSFAHTPLALRTSVAHAPLAVRTSVAHAPVAISTPVATPVIASPVLGVSPYNAFRVGYSNHGLNPLAYSGFGLHGWNSGFSSHLNNPWNAARVVSPYVAGFGSPYTGGWW